MGTRNDDLSLKLAKAVRAGFFPDVSDSEVDMLRREAKIIFKDDNSLADSLASKTSIGQLKERMKKVPHKPSVMASPPTITYNAASTIATNKKTWALTPPEAPSALAGPANITGSLTFGVLGEQNQSAADLYSDAIVGATTLQLKDRIGGGALATGNYRIEPDIDITDSFTVEDILSGENITISSVTGSSAPYTATLSAPLKKFHRADSRACTLTINTGYNATYGIRAVGSWLGITGDAVIETITDAPVLEVLCKFAGTAPTYRLWVDNEVVTELAATAAVGGAGEPAQNAMGHITINFGTRKTRRVKLELGGMYPSALITTASDSVIAPETPSIRVLWISDSFLVQTSSRDGIAPLASRQLGWDCVMVDQIGGTGYVAINGVYSTIKQRLNTHIASKPDVIVICSGLNDTFNSTYYADVQSTLAGLRKGLPEVPMFVVGPWSNGNSTNTNKATVAQAIRDATATISNAYFIDTMLGTGPAMNPWVIGTGKVGSPANNGNADFVVDTDGTHPSRTSTGGFGETYYATRIATAIASLI